MLEEEKQFMKNGGIKRRIFIFFAILSFFSLSVQSEDPLWYAEQLNSMGLFEGSNNGYELDSPLNREQSITMIVRLMGEEKQVKEKSYIQVFDDVPAERWSFPYVMYCYENGITKGTGEKEFSPEKQVTAEQYITFILRLLGYDDIFPETAYEKAVMSGLLSSQVKNDLKSKQEFLRKDMVYVSYRSLKTKTSTGKVLAFVLAEKGVITNEKAKMFDLYGTAENMDSLLDGIMN